jgi:ABC-type polar amino acid transport system ATPase subunit
MIIVSHEMGFVREVSNKIAFMDAGQILEIGEPLVIMEKPSTDRAREFMAKILRH